MTNSLELLVYGNIVQKLLWLCFKYELLRLLISKKIVFQWKFHLNWDKFVHNFSKEICVLGHQMICASPGGLPRVSLWRVLPHRALCYTQSIVLHTVASRVTRDHNYVLLNTGSSIFVKEHRPKHCRLQQQWFRCSSEQSADKMPHPIAMQQQSRISPVAHSARHTGRVPWAFACSQNLQ